MRLAALAVALMLPLAPIEASAQAPASPDTDPDTAALADELITAIDAMLVSLDGIVAELDLAVAEAPDDETVVRMLADFTAQRDALRARRAELEALKAGAE